LGKAKAVTPKCVCSFPFWKSALGDGESDSGDKYPDEIVKLQCELDVNWMWIGCELDRWFQGFRSLEKDNKMFSMTFDINVKLVPTDVQMEFIDLQNDFHL